MKKALLAGVAFLGGTGAALAGGLDRSGQPIGILFEEGNYAEFSIARVKPDLTGQDTTVPQPIGNVASAFTQAMAGVKYQITEQLSFALIADEPYGSDVTYPGNPAGSALGGTIAKADSKTLTALARYKFTDRISVYGGVRSQKAQGNITLSGLAYGGLNGYNVNLAEDRSTGYVVGAAYEIPEIALRVALTYNSAITHEFATRETLRGAVVNPGSTTEVETPESINLDFQTGIAADTLLFGSIRHAKWSDTIISPQFFRGATGGGSLTEIDDATSYTLGIGRKLTENFSASVSLGYEGGGKDDLVSPLAPSNGNKSIAIGGKYTMEQITISGGVRYTKLGDARPETGTPDTARASFRDNKAVSVGLRVGFNF